MSDHAIISFALANPSPGVSMRDAIIGFLFLLLGSAIHLNAKQHDPHDPCKNLSDSEKETCTAQVDFATSAAGW